MKTGKMFLIGLLMLVLTITSVYAVPSNQSNTGGSSGGVINQTESSSDNSGGIPQRVALVEKVLLVNEVLEITNQSHLDLKGTDYLPYDTGKLQVYLSVGDFPITTATCYASVLYPDMTYFIEYELMLHSNMTYFEGLYYLDFTVPNVTGVYPVNAICSYDTDNIENYVYDITYDGLGTSAGSSLTDLQVDDGVDFGIQDFASCNGINCTANFTLELPIGWYTGQINTARIMLEVSQTKNKNVFWYVHAPASNQTFLWFNMTSSGVEYYEQFEFNESFANETTIIVEAVGVDYQATKMDIDYLFSTRAYSGTVVNDLRGNEELVVSKGVYNISLTIQDIAGAEIEVVNNEQLGQFFLVAGFLVLLFLGMLIPSAVLGLAYSFIYLDGLLSLGGMVVCGVLIYWGNKQRNK